jgi:hypothetical protein
MFKFLKNYAYAVKFLVRNPGLCPRTANTLPGITSDITFSSKTVRNNLVRSIS